MSSSRRYFYVFFALLTLLAGAVVVLNRVVDPFWYYRDLSIVGINAIKPKFLRYERHVKPSLVQREQPASLIFGSSFSEIGFDPMHPALRAVGKSYNFALAGAQWDMVNCNVQFALKHDHALHQIVLGIHPTAMPHKDCSADLVKLEHPDIQAFLFSYDALEATVNTLLEQRRRKPSHTAEGLYFYARGVPGTANRFQQDFSHFPPCISPARQEAHPHVPIDLTGLRELLDLTKQHNIAVKLVVYPSHALSIERQYQCELRQSRWDALQDIATLVQGWGDSVALWDFEGYHEVGTEIITDAPAVYWQDLAHFNSELGNIMLDEMFGIAAPRLGMRLTPENVNGRAQAELRQRNDYLMAHPEFLQQLHALWPRH